MPFKRGMILARDLVHRGSDLDWQEGFEQGLFAASIESGAVRPDFDAHVRNGEVEMKFDMAVSCLRGGMRLTNARLQYLRDECVPDNIGEFVLVFLAVAYDHGGRKPKMADILQAWQDVDEENRQLLHLRWAVDAGVRAGMEVDPAYVSREFPVDDTDFMCMFTTHMDVPFEYFESHCSGLPDYRRPDVLASVAKERVRLAVLKAVLRSVPHASWPDYKPVVESFVKYRDAARGLIPALRTEMAAMVLAFRAVFDTAPPTRTRRGTPAPVVALPDGVKRRIVNIAVRDRLYIGYMKMD